MANYAQNKSKNYAEMASLQGDMDKDKPREKELREIRERYRDDY
jgi:peptidoglycan hydrolase CwlO-like protein